MPGDVEWDAARAAWNLAVDQRPALVVLPESADDVVETVRFARDAGLRVAPQGTGHNAHPFGSLDDTVLLKTQRMRGVEIDPVARVARVQAGTLWGEVVEAAGEHQLAALAGSSHDVGVVGYSLGGGLSFLGRSRGLAASSVTAVEIVNADGELLRADADEHPELFWAVRGGGGSFGAATALEFRLYPLAELYAGMMLFPQERAAEVLHAWRELMPSLPDEMTTIGRLLNVPPLPDIPEPLRGNSFVVVEAIYTGDEAEGARLLAPIRELGPQIDTMATIPAPALIHLHMDPPGPVPGKGDHRLLAELPAEAIDALVAAAGPQSGTPLLGVEIRQLGGALSRPAPGGGALDRVDAGYVMFAVGMTPDAAAGAAVRQGLDAVMDATAPYDAGREYLNFAEKATDVGRLYRDGAYARLRSVKAQYDPDERFRANHPIAPAQ
jgi:FAD/FMN-containing dehydrogenase